MRRTNTDTQWKEAASFLLPSFPLSALGPSLLSPFATRKEGRKSEGHPRGERKVVEIVEEGPEKGGLSCIPK